jgi:hypothetical protein
MALSCEKSLRPIAQFFNKHYPARGTAGALSIPAANTQRHEAADQPCERMKMKSRITTILFAASFAVLAMTANAQYGAPPTPPADKAATPPPAMAGAGKKLSESDIRLYREGRRACNKMTGAAREDCRKQLASKYVDKQCKNLTGQKLDDCLKAAYPGE